MSLVLRIACIIFLLLAVLSWWQKDALPPAAEILPELQRPPLQEPTDHAPISVKRDDINYTINPLFTYSLRGLVVSYNDSSSWLDFYHEEWGDTLNVRDLCVLWGGNVKNELYRHFSFKSGDFTCFYRTENGAAWRAFRQDQISNNHLLAITDSILQRIAHAEHGDQIAFSGYLASYEHDGGFSRGTSTRRDDTGNRACETVYVTDFTMLRKANVFWRTAWDISRFGLAASLLALLALFMSDVFSGYKGPDDLHHKAAQLAAAGRLKRALKLLDAALAKDPDLVEAYRDRSLVLERLGRMEEARQDMETAQRLQERQNPVNNL